MKLVIGVSGASGVIMGYRLLQELQRHPDVETHLIMSQSAERTLELETDLTKENMLNAADFAHDVNDLGAITASGSFVTDGMIVIPCSMKTLSGIANGFDANLLIRSVDVCLKEGRKVVLVPREMPLSAAHIRNMLFAQEGGCRILPAMLTFYNRADSLEEQIDHLVGKVLMQFGLASSSFRAWDGGDSHDEP